jgi:hypothetical protein
MSMNPTRELTLPRYGVRDDEMTRPGVVLLDWNDEEQTVRVNTSRQGPPTVELELDFDEDMFRPRWRGIGRSAGAVIFGIAMGVCLAIGLFVLLEPKAASGAPSGPEVDVTQR